MCRSIVHIRIPYVIGADLVLQDLLISILTVVLTCNLLLSCFGLAPFVYNPVCVLVVGSMYCDFKLEGTHNEEASLSLGIHCYLFH